KKRAIVDLPAPGTPTNSMQIVWGSVGRDARAAAARNRRASVKRLMVHEFRPLPQRARAETRAGMRRPNLRQVPTVTPWCRWRVVTPSGTHRPISWESMNCGRETQNQPNDLVGVDQPIEAIDDLQKHGDPESLQQQGSIRRGIDVG